MLHIGEILKKDYQESGLQAARYAQKLGVTRSNLYSMFGRQSIDSQHLYELCLKTGKDFFRIYSDELKKVKPDVFFDSSIPESNQPTKRKVMIEVEVSEAEFQKLKSRG